MLSWTHEQQLSSLLDARMDPILDHILFLARNVSLPHPTSEVRSVIQIAAY